MKLSKEKQSVITDAQANGFTVKYSDGCVKVYKETKHKKPRLICGIVIYADATAYRLDVPLDHALTIRSAKGMREALSLDTAHTLTKKPKGKTKMPKITRDEQRETFIAPPPAAAATQRTRTVRVWSVTSNDDNGTRTSVHGTAKGAYTELKRRWCNTTEEEAFFTLNIDAEDWPAIDAYVNAECEKPGCFDWFGVDDGPVEIPDDAAPAADDDAAEETACRKCGEPANNGEGWDGLCGTCADKEENADAQAQEQPAEPITTDIPPDPDGMNDERAATAAAALELFTASSFGEKAGGEEQNLCDLLGNFAHYCDRHGLSFSECLDRARMHYTEETDNQGTQFDK